MKTSESFPATQILREINFGDFLEYMYFNIILFRDLEFLLLEPVCNIVNHIIEKMYLVLIQII